MHLNLPEGLEKYRPDLEPLARPAARINLVSVDPRPTASKFGGEPFTPAGFRWPIVRNSQPEQKLYFLAQINFADIAKQCPELMGAGWDLPTNGLFQVFYDIEDQPWGFEAEHSDGWRFFWYPRIEGLHHVPTDFVSLPREGVGIEFKPAMTLPDEAPDRLDLGFDDEEDELYWERDDDVEVSHQVGGWSKDVQNPPFFNIPPDKGLAKTPEEHQALADRWRLILQIDSDENRLDYMWGDVGTLYIGVRDVDLLTNDLSHAWLELQCH